VEGKTPAIEDSYSYDGDGLRASQTISGKTSYLVWDTAKSPLPLLLSDGTNSYIYGPGDMPLEQVNSESKVFYLHHDQQGSTRMLTGATGTNEASKTYGAYGNVIATKGSSTMPLGYDGQYTSSDTGLIYLRARVYDPGTAQFLTADPLKAITGESYSYAIDNPTRYTDPGGLEGEAGGYGNEGGGMCALPLCIPIPRESAEGVEQLLRELGHEINEAGNRYAEGVKEYFNEISENNNEGGQAITRQRAREAEECTTVNEILRKKKGSITRAELPRGSPSWSDVGNMTLSEIRAAARNRQIGYKTILKLLLEKNYDKPS
jgi:RHS repeat-associated protein